MKNNKIILILIVILIIIAIIISIIVNAIKKETPNTNNTTPSNEVHVKTEDEKMKEEIEELKKMSEKERITFYITKYISYIEKNEYDLAYNLLYDEFKNNYFPTIEDFKAYVKNKYPNMMSINAHDIQREGKYYIMSVTFADIINNEKNFLQKFVVKEDNYDDFVLSFQAE